LPQVESLLGKPRCLLSIRHDSYRPQHDARVPAPSRPTATVPAILPQLGHFKLLNNSSFESTKRRDDET
jgi:hypothetical protein